MDWRQQAHGARQGAAHPSFRPGDLIRVWYTIRERERVRVAPFEGTVIRVHGIGASRTLTVRRVTFGEGVERVFAFDSPTIDHIEVLRQSNVHRSRLYYLRLVIGKTRIEAKSETALQKPADPLAAIADKTAETPATASEPTPTDAA